MLALHELTASSDAQIAAIAAKAVKEVSYHAERSAEWVVRLGDSTATGHARMQAAIDALWPYAAELFVADDVDRSMIARGIGFDPASLERAWSREIARVLRDATLVVPTAPFVAGEGKRGRHGAALVALLAELQSVHRRVPAERW